tara:strand:- start:682 stop:873 length:192 start_codon:yes stop_codon:yes gene_type:complete
MNNQAPQYDFQQIEEEETFVMPKAPKLRGQQAPMDYTSMSLPQSKDEFMSQNHSCPLPQDPYL